MTDEELEHRLTAVENRAQSNTHRLDELGKLTDAVNGMVRVAVQKQAAALTYQLQQNLNEQTPALVDEILEYNLKAVMSEIKYDLKFKRRQ